MGRSADRDTYGHDVVGLDRSSGMLAQFRTNLPVTAIVRGDVYDDPGVSTHYLARKSV